MALYKCSFIIIIFHVVWSAAHWHDYAPRSAAGLCGEKRKISRLDMRLGISQNRTSSDTTSNNYGNRLIDFCKSSSLYLFNGRLGVDNCKGCFTTTINSVVDYVVGSPYLLSKCVDFEICDFNNLYSDIHRGIHFTLKSIINDQLSRDSTPPCVKTNLNNQAFIWDENKKLQFVNSINIEKVKISLEK